MGNEKDFPIPDFNGNEGLYERLSSLAEKQIVTAKTKGISSQMDSKIDEIVFDLYGLTEEGLDKRRFPKYQLRVSWVCRRYWNQSWQITVTLTVTA